MKKKYRVELADGSVVSFGAKGYEDYTTHKDPIRMRSYVVRHGGVVPKRVLALEDPSEVHGAMLNVAKSTRENWSMSGVRTPGFWSRWLLWSHPDIGQAERMIRKKGVTIKSLKAY
jgi:hypothetical protein